ncbi:MAG TPA: SMI1/KNR4 family protein, partial [Actinoplanes sp.]|nr:SMI1/KNR4 family protein [Actinoplanes sp.]
IKPFAHIRAFTPTAGDENPAHSSGLLYLCHQGCALREALVVSGPSRGQMWADYTAEGDGFHPMQNPDGARMNFTDWYRTWLTRAERNAAVAPADSPL